MPDDPASVLEDGLSILGLPVTLGPPLLRYMGELQQWNAAYNLTAIQSPPDMVTKHLLDSLAVLPHLHGRHIIDVGSGAGLPGIPLALANPTRRFTLLDSNGKKAAFLRHAGRALGLAQVEVVNARAEDYAQAEGKGRFDSVLSRAFASLAEMLECTGQLCALHGKILAMKGRFPEDELEDLRHTASGFEVEAILPLEVPGLAAERHLVIFCRSP